jgi:hypothetical protein
MPVKGSESEPAGLTAPVRAGVAAADVPAEGELGALGEDPDDGVGGADWDGAERDGPVAARTTIVPCMNG